MDNSELNDFWLAINKSELSNSIELSEPGADIYEAYVNQLTPVIELWLDNEPQKLWAALYRMDVYESKIKRVLQTAYNPARALAELIIQRRMQTLAIRKKYKESENQ